MEKLNLLRLFFIQILWLFVFTSADTATNTSTEAPTSTVASTSTSTTGTNLNCTVNTIYRREHSLGAPIKGSEGGKIVDWDWEYKGHTEVVENDNFVRLFPTGSLWNTQPVKLNDWEFEVEFKTHRVVTESLIHRTPNLVFWYSKDKTTPKHASDFHIVVKTDLHLDEAPVESSGSNSITDSASRKKKHSSILIVVGNVTRSYDDVKDYWGDRRSCWEKLKHPSSKLWLRVRYERHHLTVSTSTSTTLRTGARKWNDCVHERENTTLLTTDNHYFGLSASDLPDSNSTLDVHQIKTFELDLQYATAPACEGLHFHDDDDHDDELHRPVLGEKRVRREHLPPDFKFPFVVLAVPLVGMIIVAAFCIIGINERTRAAAVLERLAPTEDHYGNRPQVITTNPPVI